MKNRVILTALLFALFISSFLSLSGCEKTINKYSTQDSVSSTSESQVTEDISSDEYTLETIPVTEPNNPSRDTVINALNEIGLSENFIRKKYTFDEDRLNSTNNKYYVIDRMCNSIDYFTTLQASYIKKINGKETWVTYIIDRRTSSAKELLCDVSAQRGHCIPTNYYCVDGNYHLKLLFDSEAQDKYSFDLDTSSDDCYKDNYNAVYDIFKQTMSDKLAKVTDEPQVNLSAGDDGAPEKYIDPMSRILHTENESFFYYARPDTVNLATSSEHYFPQYLAYYTMMKDLSKWKISDTFTEGARDTIEATGSYLKYDDENLEQTFTICIDKNTGVLISKQIKNASGKTIEEWNNISFAVDCTTDDVTFDDIKK